MYFFIATYILKIIMLTIEKCGNCYKDNNWKSKIRVLDLLGSVKRTLILQFMSYTIQQNNDSHYRFYFSINAVSFSKF